MNLWHIQYLQYKNASLIPAGQVTGFARQSGLNNIFMTINITISVSK